MGKWAAGRLNQNLVGLRPHLFIRLARVRGLEQCIVFAIARALMPLVMFVVLVWATTPLLRAQAGKISPFRRSTGMGATGLPRRLRFRPPHSFIVPTEFPRTPIRGVPVAV